MDGYVEGKQEGLELGSLVGTVEVTSNFIEFTSASEIASGVEDIMLFVDGEFEGTLEGAAVGIIRGV